MLWRLSVFLPLALLAPLALSRLHRVRAPHLLSELWLGLLSSLAVALVLVCIGKLYIGRLRPDFLARCLPVNGVCTGDRATIREGRKSFPSGHSALSFAGLGYVSCAIYAALAATATPRLGRLWKLAVASLPWMLALHIALSRIEDYWHHWQDVLVGSCIGHATALLGFRMRFPPPAENVGLIPKVVLAEGGGGGGGDLVSPAAELVVGAKQHLSPAVEAV